MTNPTITIIAGAATVPEHYAPLRSAFEARGFPTACGEPPSITVEDAASVSVDTDAAFLREEVLGPLLADGKDVVLLLHSYGGAYGAVAAKGLSKKERTEKGEKGGIVGIVYVASFTVELGQSALEALGISDLPPGIAPGNKPGTLIFTIPQALWPSLSPEEGASRIAKMKPCSITAIGSPVSYAPYQDPYYDGAIAFVRMEGDLLISEDMKHTYLANSGITLTKNLKGGHGIDAESTDDVADTVLGFVDAFGRV